MLNHDYQTRTLSFSLNGTTEMITNVDKHFNEVTYFLSANPSTKLVIDFSFNIPRENNEEAHYILRQLKTDNYYLISVDAFQNLLKSSPTNN